MHSWIEGISAFEAATELNGLHTSSVRIIGWLLDAASTTVILGVITEITRANRTNMLPVFIK